MSDPGTRAALSPAQPRASTSTGPVSPLGSSTVDGRRARRERGRVAVVEAMLELVSEGHVPPMVDELAARAGVSAASVFRYFDTLDDLRDATASTFLARHADAFRIPDIGVGSLHDRAESFAATRVALYRSNEPMARLVRRGSGSPDRRGDVLHSLRSERIGQVRCHFATELRRRTPAERDDLVTVISTLTSFESWDQAVNTHERSDRQIRRAWSASVERLLTG